MSELGFPQFRPPRAFRQLLGAPQGCARPPCVTCGQAHTRASARAPPNQPHPLSPWGLGARQLPALPLPTPCWGPGLFPVRLRPVVSGCRSQEAVGPGVGGAQRACWGHPSRAGDFPVHAVLTLGPAAS